MRCIQSVFLMAILSGCLPFPAASPTSPPPIPATPGVAGAAPAQGPSAAVPNAQNAGLPTSPAPAQAPGSGGQPATPATPATPAATPMAFSAVQPALTNDCGGGGCHAYGAQTSLDASTKAGIYQRVSSGTMPPSSAPPLSAADKQAILQYCSQ